MNMFPERAWPTEESKRSFAQQVEDEVTKARAVLAGEGAHDPVEYPRHYTSHPSGIEAIQVTEHMSFCLGNAVKYVWRADLKADAIEDLRKAVWYIEREIARREDGSGRDGVVID